MQLKESIEKSKKRLELINEKKNGNLDATEYMTLINEEKLIIGFLKVLEESLFLETISECQHHFITYDKEGTLIYHCLKCGLNNSGEEIAITGNHFTLDYTWKQNFPDELPPTHGVYNNLDEALEGYQKVLSLKK